MRWLFVYLIGVHHTVCVIYFSPPAHESLAVCQKLNMFRIICKFFCSEFGIFYSDQCDICKYSFILCSSIHLGVESSLWKMRCLMIPYH